MAKRPKHIARNSPEGATLVFNIPPGTFPLATRLIRSVQYDSELSLFTNEKKEAGGHGCESRTALVPQFQWNC